MTESIHTASSADDYADFAALVTEYVDWSRTRYQENSWLIDKVFGYQSLASELKTLSSTYGPPKGKTLLASRDGHICGGGAYRQLADGSCEMKRLFVRREFGGAGTGRRLCNALIQSARDDGYTLMRLDTGTLLREAIAMYKSIGFKECACYHQYPQELMPHLIFMELPLTGTWSN
ncbi:MAG: GNAT family N-acetyltransferase [Casimicrobiaceae bacterium]